MSKRLEIKHSFPMNEGMVEGTRVSFPVSIGCSITEQQRDKTHTELGSSWPPQYSIFLQDKYISLFDFNYL